MKNTLFLAVYAITLWLCAACEPKKVKVGVSMDILDGRWKKDKEFIQEKISELGGEAMFTVAQGDHEMQAKQVNELVEKGIDVLIIVPCNSVKASELVKLAKAEGVKVIAYDRFITNSDLDLYVSFDNMKVGEMQSEYLLKKVPQGNYLLLGGSPTDNNAKMFRQGQMKPLEPQIQAGNISIIGDGWADGWNPIKSYEQTLALLNSGKKIDAVVASNDQLATGAIRAFREKRLALPVIVGQDADRDACKRIADGYQAMTIYKPVKDLAFSAAVAAVMLAQEQEIPNLNAKLYNGLKDVPSILLPPLKVDKHNMGQTVIADGFVLKEYVYGEEGRHKRK